eukprot:CAMPEP_0170178476 /NCGR_PEP_ID=MMETSP0040_2-20121228/11909_1 /TAXON_ID=641309 /ORGANISM="Lotharella oceanica, Strain CCMP622" /LENGTH=151 /DNA_ID=CAMNT_0010421547 /DNA_START=166 /DNA_END=621 /DNA_ORIENTATION=-
MHYGLRRYRGGGYDDQPDALGVFTIHDLPKYGWKEDWMLEDDQAYMDVYIPLDNGTSINECKVKYEPYSLRVDIRGEMIINGTLFNRISPSLCMHEIEVVSGRRFRNSRYLNKRCLHVQLAKFQWMVWQKLFVDEPESKSWDQKHAKPGDI